MKNIPVIIFILLFIFSCAKPNKTFAPEEPKLTVEKVFPTTGYVRDFTISDNYLFATVDQNGFSVFDLQTDTLVINYTNYLHAPRLISIAQDTLLFVYDLYGSPASINCFNISDINNPQYLPPILSDTAGLEDFEVLTTESDTIKITYTKNDASSNKIKMINATITNNFWQFTPEFDANQVFDYPVHHFCKYQNGIYYIANEQKGVAVLDISNPFNPLLQSYIDTPGSAYDVKRVDNYLYIADKHEGFEVFKLDENNVWNMIYHYDTSGYAKQLAYSQDYVALASGGGGIYLFDISDKTNISLFGHIDDDEIGYTYRTKFFAETLYVGTRNGIYQLKIEK